MSLLTYNGLALNLVKVQEWTRQAVYAANNYLYTKHRIVVRAVINPGTQTGTLLGLPSPVTTTAGGPLTGPAGPIPFVPAPPLDSYPGGVPGLVGPVAGQIVGLPGVVGRGPRGGADVPGVVSEAALRHDLMQPRRQLVYSVGGAVTLMSPLTGFTADCTNGPKPFYFNVVDITGPRTFTVDYGIETDVNECPTRTSPNHYILSHTWSMQHDLDQDFFAKRVITGRVVFRADVLNANPALAPDDFRQLFLFLIPSNMKRERVIVRAEDDGVTLNYQVEDRELPININSSMVTRCEAVHSVRMTKGEEDKIARQINAAALTGAISVIASDSNRSRGPAVSFTGSIAGLFGAAVGGFGGRFTAAMAALPLVEHAVQVRVWGHRNASRAQLEDFAWGVVNARLGAMRNVANAVLMGVEAATTHDITGRFVQVEQKFIGGPGVAGVGGVQRSAAAVFQPSINQEESGTLLVLGTQAGAAGPPGGDPGRGTYLERCVAGALLGPCGQVQGLPTTPVRNNNPPVTM